MAAMIFRILILSNNNMQVGVYKIPYHVRVLIVYCFPVTNRVSSLVVLDPNNTCTSDLASESNFGRYSSYKPSHCTVEVVLLVLPKNRKSSLLQDNK